MILVDRRTGSKELFPIIKSLGIPCELSDLEFGDIAFEGNTSSGRELIGVERKTLSDMLHCIDDARYSAHQKVGMAQMYRMSILMLEGLWARGTPPFLDGVLITSDDSNRWYPLRYRSQKVMYSKLYRYLLSVSLSGVVTTLSRNIHHTACNVVECYHYFQKRWQDHTSLLETQKLNIPELRGKPTLCRRWAADLTDVGVKFSMEAERMFRTPIRLAKADELEWMAIKGVGATTAQRIIREINGWGGR